MSIRAVNAGHGVLRYSGIIFIVSTLILAVLLSLYPFDKTSDDKHWRVSGEMLQSRIAAGTVVVDDRLYVIGGSDSQGYITHCEWVPLADDGTMGEWQQASVLPEPRGYVAAVSHNGFVYVIGGANGDHGSNLLSSVERAKILADGSLSEWTTEKNLMTTPRRGGTAVATNGYVYAIGGYNGLFLDTVERSKIQPDGSLGEWQYVSSMLHGRYIQATTLVGDTLYVIGGHKRSMGGALSSVEFARLKEDGSLGNWAETEPINVARYDGSAVSINGSLFLVGGYDKGAVDAVEKARINADGSLAPWKIVSRTAISRNSSAVAVHDNHIYSAGGSDNYGRYLNSIEMAQVDKDGVLQFWP